MEGFNHKKLRDMKLVDIQGIGLNHPLDGVTGPKYKLLCFLTTELFLLREVGASF
jgi:hypothetical protein